MGKKKQLGYSVCSSCSQPLGNTQLQPCNHAISDYTDPRNCKKMGCPWPSSPKCEFIFVKRFVDVAAFFRNPHSHATSAVYSSSAEGKPALENFQLSTFWEDI